MTKILHASDPHFGTEQAPVVAALCALSRQQSPDVLVLSGDVTQRARASQFASAAEFVRELGIAQRVLVPGNHDVPLFDLAARAVRPYAGYQRVFGPELEPTLSTPDCLIMAVKTTRRYRHVNGELDDRQIQRVVQGLRQASQRQLRIVVMHQPVAVPRASEQHNVCHGSESAVRAWADAGLDIVLAGHIHLPFVLPLAETFHGLSRPVWAVNAGTALSSRIRYDAGNSVNVLQTSNTPTSRSCTVEQWSYQALGAAFVRSSALELSFP
jgi:3',5'-cyclic AMP phosphodiesterase CpdA